MIVATWPRFFASLAIAAGLSCAAIAKEAPYLSGPVIDEAGLLRPVEKEKLEQYIRSNVGLAQMQVWIFPSLDGDSIEHVSYEAARKWKLGTEKGDNGILLAIAVNDRRMRFEVGRGLEGNIPDILSARILDYAIRPAFREGRYFDGIAASLEQVVTLAGGGENAAKVRDQLSEHADHGRGGMSPLFVILIFLFFFVFPLLGRGWLGPALFFGGFGGGSGGGGGGGWSGGGGSFGGGGSSSSW